MQPFPVHPREAERMAALASYEVLDTAADPRIDIFVRIAAQLFDVPLSLVSLVDDRRVWFKACYGGDFTEAPRDIVFCSHAIMRPDEVMVVEDTLGDPRFRRNPLVTGPPGIRFYAGAPIRDSDGLPLGTLCILDHKSRLLDDAARQRLADLATGVGAALDLHRAAIQLERAATHDPLTGLANRALFNPALEQAAAQARADAPCALFVLGLDRFKAVNDQYGLAAGDGVLREAARRLRSVTRPSDLLARIGGDEFALLVRAPLDPGGPGALAGRILDAMAEPFIVGTAAATLRASIGYAVGPSDARDGAGLMQRAERALDRAKHASPGASLGAAPNAAPNAAPGAAPGAASGAAASADLGEPGGPDSSALMRDLGHAVDAQAFTLAWQPYFEVGSGQVVGSEALLRWDRPGHGAASPAVFVPLAESAGWMPRIDHWVLQAGCKAAASWPLDLDVSINVTAATFCQRSFSRDVHDALSRSGLAPRRLVLEVTERMAVESPAAARRCIAELHALGVRVALDDFGIGFSALAALKEFAFDKLKLDRSFIHDIGRDARAEAVARTVIELGHATGMTVCAEGVETPEQLEFLRKHGCELAQGFMLGRPASVACMRDLPASLEPNRRVATVAAAVPRRRPARR